MKGADVMNIFILGGLFALGIAAIVVIVVLARREQGQNTASANGTAGQAPSSIESHPNSEPSVPATSPTQKLTIPLDQRNTLVGRDEQAVGVQLIPGIADLADHPPDGRRKRFTPPDGAEHLRGQPGELSAVTRTLRYASGQTEFQQFHELADEIRILHQHAWNLEQRLGRLSDLADHIEHAQNGHTSVEEEPSLPETAVM